MRRAPVAQTIIPLDGNRFYQGLFQSITGSPYRSFPFQLPGIDKNQVKPTALRWNWHVGHCLPASPTYGKRVKEKSLSRTPKPVMHYGICECYSVMWWWFEPGPVPGHNWCSLYSCLHITTGTGKTKSGIHRCPPFPVPFTTKPKTKYLNNKIPKLGTLKIKGCLTLWPGHF
jgi:hypothetical protein